MHLNKTCRACLLVGIAIVGAFYSAPVKAQYEPAKLPDPARRWSVNAALRGEWDDNIFTSSDNETASFKTTLNPRFLLNIPLEQTFIGLRYAYQASYFENRPGDQIDQTHSADVLFSHTFNPRLVLDLNDRLRFGVEPELVELRAGDEVLRRRRGDYFLNTVDGGLQYDLSPRWQMGVKGLYELWDYDTQAASTNDRSIYQATLTATYLLNPRTSVGGNYRYGIIDYKIPGADDERNSESHYVYATIARSFSPRLTGRIDGGVELRQFGDNTDNFGPFVDGSLSYSYREGSAVSAGFSYAITTTELVGFRSTDTATIYGRLTHRFTPKLSGSANGVVAFSSFDEPTAGSTIEPLDEQTIGAGVQLQYAFTRWLSGETGYHHDHVYSDLSGREFVRNRVYIGARVTY